MVVDACSVKLAAVMWFPLMRRDLSQPPSMAYISHITHYSVKNGVLFEAVFYTRATVAFSHEYTQTICLT